MSQAIFSVRMDNSLKESFAAVCEKLGMSMATAINIFATSVVNNNKIPFEITTLKDTNTKFLQTLDSLRSEAINNKFNNMTLDDINKIINKTRRERK